MKAADSAILLVIVSRHYGRLLSLWRGYILCLFGFRANLAVHLARSPLNYSYGYASACDRISGQTEIVGHKNNLLLRPRVFETNKTQLFGGISALIIVGKDYTAIKE